MYFQTTRFKISIALLLAAGAGACVATVDDSALTPEQEEAIDPDARARVGDARFEPWRRLRAQRQAELDAYLSAHSAELDAFTHRAVGVGGVPTLLLSKFGLAMPDIWGDPHLGAIGLFEDPGRPGTTLGLGKNVAPNGVEVQTLTCGGCHTGRVKLEDGSIRVLVGAPNTTFNQFRANIERTVADPRYLAIFGDNALTQGFRTGVGQKRGLLDQTLVAVTYAGPNAPNIDDEPPGLLDAFSIAVSGLLVGDLQAALADPTKFPAFDAARRAVMPPVPVQSDIMSVWRQKDRPLAQWDGTIISSIYRNLGASLGVVGDPNAVDFGNASSAVPFTRDLPPPPYPFDVDMGMAAVGKVLYEVHCARCHNASNTTLYPASVTRTDANRLEAITPANRVRLTAALRLSCKDPAQCTVPDEQILRDTATTGKGYMAVPLDGIWARAPYLHNGSVANLRALLVPSERKATFVRGSLRYDQVSVGFVADDSALADPNTQPVDTTLSGMGNRGHDNAAFNGIDWKRNDRALNALLEYMKTL